MESNAMVVYYPSSINDLLEMSVPLVTVQLELQSLHANMIA
jgi:hypothetical protein